jgi:hypothetical protein
VNKVLEDPAFANMTVTCQLALGSQIGLGVNSSCSRWVGIIELVKSQDVDVFNKRRRVGPRGLKLRLYR